MVFGQAHMLHVWNIYLHLVHFWGKCRYIYHTWSLWEDFVPKKPSDPLTLAKQHALRDKDCCPPSVQQSTANSPGWPRFQASRVPFLTSSNCPRLETCLTGQIRRIHSPELIKAIIQGMMPRIHSPSSMGLGRHVRS